MKSLIFKGGIHPKDGKDLAKNQAITTIFPKGDLVYPLSQHIGAPAIPVVEVGEEVLAGQKIAKANGFVSAPIHTSVSGKVKAIEPHFLPNGTKVDSIIIENDGQYQSVDYCKVESPDALSREEILEMIGDAGIVGMGGAGFPTKVKLSPREPEKIEYVIANGAECEPYITADYRRMLENPEELISGMRVILHLFEHATGIFAIEDNKLDCVRILEQLIKDEPRMEVKVLKTRYPQGAERQLVYATTGRTFGSNMLPADVGCVVNNIETLIAVHHAVILGRPLTERVVTVSGDAIKNPGNFKVLLGTNQQELLEAAEGFIEEPAKIISGGPMMGFAMFTTDTPVTKTSSSILCFTKDEIAEHEPSACINCGRCVDVCPSRIIPSKLADFSERFDEEAFLKWHGMECVECGCCSYKCPAKRQLKQAISCMKKTVLANRKRKGK